MKIKITHTLIAITISCVIASPPILAMRDDKRRRLDQPSETQQRKEQERLRRDLDRQLRQALTEGNLDAIREQLNAGADPSFFQQHEEHGTALHFAIRETLYQHACRCFWRNRADYPKALELLLKAATNLNVRDVGGKTPLHAACDYASEKKSDIQLLLQAGADPNAYYRRQTEELTPLHMVARTNCGSFHFAPPAYDSCRGCEKTEALTKLLLNAGASPDSVATREVPLTIYNPPCYTAYKHTSTPLHIAAQHNAVGAVRALLAAGVDLECRTKNSFPYERNGRVTPAQIIHTIIQARHDSAHFQQILEQIRSSYTPLAIAAAEGSYETVQSLLEAGANPNIRCRPKTGKTPLHLVAMLKCCADPEEQGQGWNSRHYTGEEVGHYATHHQCGNAERVARLLLQYGATPHTLAHVGGHAVTPLHLASACGKAGVIQALLEAGAGTKDTELGNAFVCAVVSSKKENAATLSHAGADVEHPLHATALVCTNVDQADPADSEHATLMQKLAAENNPNHQQPQRILLELGACIQEDQPCQWGLWQ